MKNHYQKTHLSTVFFISKCLRLNNKIVNTIKSTWWHPVAHFNSLLECCWPSVKALDVMNVTERQDTVLSTQLSCSATHWLLSIGPKGVKGWIKQPFPLPAMTKRSFNSLRQTYKTKEECPHTHQNGHVCLYIGIVRNPWVCFLTPGKKAVLLSPRLYCISQHKCLWRLCLCFFIESMFCWD